MPNVQKRVCNVYIFQLSFHFTYHRWWLGILVEYYFYDPSFSSSLPLHSTLEGCCCCQLLISYTPHRQSGKSTRTVVSSPILHTKEFFLPSFSFLRWLLFVDGWIDDDALIFFSPPSSPLPDSAETVTPHLPSPRLPLSSFFFIFPDVAYNASSVCCCQC